MLLKFHPKSFSTNRSAAVRDVFVSLTVPGATQVQLALFPLGQANKNLWNTVTGVHIICSNTLAVNTPSVLDKNVRFRMPRHAVSLFFFFFGLFHHVSWLTVVLHTKVQTETHSSSQLRHKILNIRPCGWLERGRCSIKTFTWLKIVPLSVPTQIYVTLRWFSIRPSTHTGTFYQSVFTLGAFQKQFGTRPDVGALQNRPQPRLPAWEISCDWGFLVCGFESDDRTYFKKFLQLPLRQGPGRAGL